MARPTGSTNDASPAASIEEQTQIALRAARTARKCPDKGARRALYDIAVAHFAALAARMEREKREGTT